MHLAFCPSLQVIEVANIFSALRAHHLSNWQLILQGFLPPKVPTFDGWENSSAAFLLTPSGSFSATKIQLRQRAFPKILEA